MKKVIISILVVILFASCKPTQTVTNTVIETRTDTITVAETVKTEPIVDSIVIIKEIIKEKPVYYRDKNWEMSFLIKNDSLFAEIKHLTDSIEHLNTKTTINNFRSEKTEVVKENTNGRDKSIPFVFIGFIVMLMLLLIFVKR